MKLQHWTPKGPTAFDNASNYGGDDLSSMLKVPLIRSRDSDPLEKSNFAVMLQALGGESDTVQVHRFGHWAVGWFESILIAPSDHNAIRIAENMMDRYANYPCLDEEDYSEREYEYVCLSWDNISISERIKLCAQFGISIFAARKEYGRIDDVNGQLFDYLRTP